MSREGRSQPVQPSAWHGFVGNVPANGVLPRPPVNVDRFDERRRYVPLVPVVVSGVLAPTLLFVAPPRPQSVEQDGRRSRFRAPPDPTVLNGLLASLVTAPTVTPPGPFVVPLDERRRFLSQLPPTVLHGADLIDPPAPNVVEPDDRRRRRPTPDLTIITAARFFVAPFVQPPPPIVSFVTDDRVQRRGLTAPTILRPLVVISAPTVVESVKLIGGDNHRTAFTGSDTPLMQAGGSGAVTAATGSDTHAVAFTGGDRDVTVIELHDQEGAD
jgi:hypothetical protein